MFTREGDAGFHRHIQRRGSWPGVQPDERLCIPRGKRQQQRRPVHRGQPAHTQRMVQLPDVHPQTVRPTERSPRAQNPDAKSRDTRDNAVRLRHVEPARVLLRHAAPSPPQVLDSLHRLAKAVKTGSESIEATLPRRRILFAGFMARLEDTRLPKCVMFGEMVGGAGCAGGQEKEWMGCFLDDLRAFGINADQWATAAQDEGEWRRTAEQGAEHFMAKWIAAEKNEAELRHAVVCPNMTGRAKERIAQSKRACAGSLALVD